MKHFLALFVSFTLLGFDTEKGDNDVYGTWRGGYGIGQEVNQAFVKFKPGNAIEFYENAITKENRSLGTYALQGDTAILITYYKPGGNMYVMMRGNLNKSKNFVDGVWESSLAKGSFYFQKQ